MDLLGSILNSMDKPPSVSDKQRIQMRKQKEALLKRQKEEKEKLKLFREKIEEEINKFLLDVKRGRHKFEPMEHVFRSIVLDVAEVAGISSFSVGEEGVDRHVVIYKREFAPSEDELAALKRGEDWTPELAKELAEKRELEKQEALNASRKSSKTKFIPNSNYKEKYEHIIGKDAALAAARKTESNKQYGFVPSENKKDLRSIEQTLADIQSKRKKQKVAHDAEQSKEKEEYGEPSVTR